MRLIQFKENRDTSCFPRQLITLNKLKLDKELRAIILVLVENP
jgi:hypothetical protein